jgi:histidyl-tRNA synthetase
MKNPKSTSSHVLKLRWMRCSIPYEIDERLVRGLDYYTHTVFEVVSTRPDSGAQATIFAGGRYDHFVEYYGGPEMSGIGFAIGWNG